MICGSCQRDIADNSNFCYHCGAKQSAAYTQTAGSGVRRLRCSRTDKVFGGVCGGFGEYFEIDPVILRVIWGILAVVGGVGILAYLICWIVIDLAPEGSQAQTAPLVNRASAPRRLRRSATNAKWAGVCGGIAEHLGVDATGIRLAWVILSVMPGAIVGGLIAYLVAWLVMAAPDTSQQAQPLAHSS